MSKSTAEIIWERGDQKFVDNRYSRKHILRFDGGLEIPASSSPDVVPPPYSDTSAVDPEEMLVASLANCHMLWFLSLAAKKGFCVDTYVDQAVGIMSKNSQGKLFLSQVNLNPLVTCSGEKIPTSEEFQQLHHHAHEECFIANSVLTEIICNAVLQVKV